MPRPRASISDIEFESLPPALRRKYFSSLERLRLAKDGGTPSPHLSRNHGNVKARIRTQTQTFSNDLDRRLRQSTGSLRNRFHRRLSVVRGTPATYETAAWFASLPPAVQRKHFTREEQILFASERHSIIFDAADEVLHRRHWQDSFLDNTVSPREHPRTSYFPETKSEHSSSRDAPTDMATADYSLDSFRWLEEDGELDLRLDDYHTEIAEMDSRQRPSYQRRSFRPRISLSNIALHRNSASSPPSSHGVSRSTTSSMQFNMARPSSQTSLRHKARGSVSSIDPRATHYQDQTARMKLRVYLASPSKFDEAIEFGFPTLQDQENLEKARPNTGTRTTHDSGRTFFSDGTPSLSGDDGDDGEELDTIQDPRTPDESTFRDYRRPRVVNNETMTVRPQHPRGLIEGYPQGNALDREMTLHMTLTRPDLRTPDELRTQAADVNALPLEQADLNFDNSVSIWDTLPNEESKVKRLLKKLKLK